MSFKGIKACLFGMLSWTLRMLEASLTSAAKPETGSEDAVGSGDSRSGLMDSSKLGISEPCSDSGSGCETPLSSSNPNLTVISSTSKAW